MISHRGLYQNAAKCAQKFNMLDNGDRIVVSLSGGPDSMALLFFLREFTQKREIELFALHVNHMIRGAVADKDAAFVERMCLDNGVKLLSVKKNVPQIAKEKKMSLEEAGRFSRREAYKEAIEQFSANKIALGHNKNDNAETFLLMLFRGAGSKGLSGISAVNDFEQARIIRPLIQCERRQIEAYCAENSIEFVTDETNLKPVYTRNKVRLTLLPWIENNLNADVIHSLEATAEILKEQSDFLDSLAQKAYAASLREKTANSLSLNLPALSENADALKKLVLREAIKDLRGNLKDISYVHISDILSLLDKPSGKRINLPGGIVCEKKYSSLVLYVNAKSASVNKPPGFCYELFENDTIFVKEDGVFITFSQEQLKLDNFKNLCTKLIKCDKILTRVYYRTRLPGDKIKLPFGTKKLSDYFTDKKIPRSDRDLVRLIADNDNVLIALNHCESELSKNGANNYYIQFWENLGR